jgi:oxygen-independent coproporphyrinogen-3 oxidase
LTVAKRIQQDDDLDLAGLYIHVPFCTRVCPYCDFAVTTGGSEKQRRFVDHLLREVDLYAEEPWRFDTVYLGGGTPSRLPLGELERIVESVRGILGVVQNAGLSLEVNPEDVQAEKLSAWRSLDFDFISLGVQSFCGENLAFLGRQHSPAEAQRAVEATLKAGFSTVSLDLIYGFPDQPCGEWKADLEQAVALKPHHLSCYQLTVHEATVFGRRRARGRLREASEEQQAELFDFTHRFLLDAGFGASFSPQSQVLESHSLSRSRPRRPFLRRQLSLVESTSHRQLGGRAGRWPPPGGRARTSYA